MVNELVDQTSAEIQNISENQTLATPENKEITLTAVEQETENNPEKIQEKTQKNSPEGLGLLVDMEVSNSTSSFAEMTEILEAAGQEEEDTEEILETEDEKNHREKVNNLRRLLHGDKAKLIPAPTKKIVKEKEQKTKVNSDKARVSGEISVKLHDRLVNMIIYLGNEDMTVTTALQDAILAYVVRAEKAFGQPFPQRPKGTELTRGRRKKS